MSYPHSGPGIASFIASLFAGAAILALVVVAGVMGSQPGGMDEESPQAIILGLGLIASAGLLVLSFVLGVTGMLQPKRNKLFAIMEATIAALVVVGFCGLIVLGMVMTN
ncbi:MAG: hypothetical protein JWP89_5999 [Schlesneria sp.]|nr:hypothetical protein [Schlesneria sp.]